MTTQDHPNNATEANSTQHCSLAIGEVKTFIGIAFVKSWRIVCPCGVAADFPLNGLPEVDTRHPCGNPDHWTIKMYQEQPK